jgi:gliding motility-associated-like protein
LNVITFTAINPSIITDVIIKDFSGNNAVEIKTTGTGPFEYSLDGEVFQKSPLFTNVPAGEYNVYARNTSTCDLSTTTIYILDYPRFFTPNADGYNDLWKIKNLDLYPKAIVTIFDRYGKFLKQLNASSKGWNGIYKGIPLPADDYWFDIKFTDSKTIKGHFSLKR